MARSKRVTEAQLAELGQKVSTLVKLFTGRLDALENNVGLRLGALEDEVNSLRETTVNIDVAAVANDVPIDGPAAPVEEGLKPYELAEATSLYVSGENPYQVAEALLAAAELADLSPTSLDLSVQWVPGDVTALLPEDRASYFAGHATVAL